MKNIFNCSIYFILLIAISAGCASSYHIEKSGGGFSVTKLAQNTYQVRNQSNKNTSQKDLSEYILRRCAQMTLEQGNRYFIISSQSHSYDESHQSSTSFGQVIFKILADNKQQNLYPVLDAITIVKETDEVAEGRLSNKARRTYNRLIDTEKYSP